MVTKQEYSLLSAAVYNDARDQLNKLDVSSLGWTTIASEGGSKGGMFSSGLSINAYKKGNEIVVACKGTDFLIGSNNPQTASDLIADIGLGGSLGFSSSQLFQAVLFYQRVKEQNPGAAITFTGHSLGAGLASILSVWFDKPATIFADAPFELTALNPLVQAYVASYLALNGYVDSAFTNFITTAPFIYSTRESRVTSYYVKDEVLNNWLGALYFVVGDNRKIDVGGTDLLSPLTLHSIVLHSSLLISEQLRLDTFVLPHLLARIFDEKLYAAKLESRTQDFLTKLLQAQIPLINGDASSGPLTHFAEDMRKLGTRIDGLSPAAQDALIAQSIEWYYWKGPGSGSQGFFTQTGSLLQYTSAQGAGLDGAQNKAVRYVDAWLNPIASAHGTFAELANYDQWNVVSGAEATTAVAQDGSKTQIFIGGAGGDTLTGGNSADTLYAGEGDDVLSGGASTDLLAGGGGVDTYHFTGAFGSDTIVDSDGLGSIQVDGNTLTGGKKVEGLDNVWRNAEQGYTFALAGNGADRSLRVIKDNSLDAIRIKGWQDGQLGLVMDTSAAPPLALQHIYNGDQRALLVGGAYDWSSTHWGVDGSLIGGVAEENFFDVILGSLDRDLINGLGGKDVLQGWLGDDEINGGEGGDLITGGPGRDLIHGGSGDDVIMGAGTFYYFDYNPYSYSSVQAWNPVFGVNALAQVQFDPIGMNQWVNGAQTWVDLTSPDPDVIGAGDGDDIVFGSGYDDVVAGDGGEDLLWGMEGSDIMAGGDGGDVLVGDVDGTDYALRLSQGSDVPPVIYGKDFLDGGDGNDVLLGGGAGDALYGGTGNDLLAGDGSSGLLLDGNYGNHLVSAGQQGDDFLDGGDGDDTLTGAGGSDVLIGGAGVDALDGGTGNDSFSAGAGDTVTDGDGIDSLLLADGSAASVTTEDADLLLSYGTQGTLRIVDALRGSIEFIDGIRMGDWLKDHLNEAIYVESSGEGQSLNGGSGSDTLATGHSHVRLAGGAGSDTYVVGHAGVMVVEEADEGTDTVQSTLSHTLAENVENLTLTGTAAVNGTGNTSDNVLIGNAAANVLAGGFGNDTLNGGDGDDMLYGEGGNDTLYASRGNDTLAGGDGLDTYVLNYSVDRSNVVDNSAEGSIVKLGTAGMKFEDLYAARRANDLVVEVRGTSASMRIKDYYAATQTSWMFEDANGNTTTGEALVAASQMDWTQLQANLLKDFQSNALGSISRGYSDNGYTQRVDGSWCRADSYGVDISKAYVKRTELFKNLSGVIISYVAAEEWNGDLPSQLATDTTATITFQANAIASGTATLQSYNYAFNSENAWSSVSWAKDSSFHFESEWNLVYDAGMMGYIGYIRTDIDTDYYTGTANQLSFQDPGAPALAGNLPSYIAVDFQHRQDSYNLGPSLLADGDQTVSADGHSAVIGGVGNNTIYGAGFAYGGTGNAQLIGGGTLMAGTGDQLLQFGATMVVGDGHDTVVGRDSSRILVNPDNLGIDLVGQDFDWESDVDNFGQSQEITAIYRAMGYEDWKKNYQYGGKYRLDFGEDFEGYFDSLEEARAAFVPSDAWPTFDDAMAYAFTTWRYVAPLTALYKTPYTSVEDPASGLIASSYYAEHGITPTLLTATDFAALQPLLQAELLPQGIVSFGPGLSLADLTLSWGEAVASLDGATHVTLDILWGTDQGIRIMMPRSGDGLNSVAQRFEFSDGTVSSLLELIALAPRAPDFEHTHVMSGTVGADKLIGTIGRDALYGLAGDDTLNGGAGPDMLAGGLGNDVYTVDDAGDMVVELAGEGTDTVRSLVSYTLGTEIENLVLTGTAAINGVGNAVNNVLTGNAAINTLTGGDGNDALNGGAGADTLIGGAGNDSFTVDDALDVVMEFAGEGTDTVRSSIGYTLGTEIEKLVLTGTAAINGIGNAMNNVLTGNAAANTLTGDEGNDALNGGAGADTLIGGAGNDSFTVDDAGDVVVELAGEGADTVRSFVSYTLGTEIENLVLTGTAAINGAGHAGNNVLTGNEAANTLMGGEGNDTLIGGAGADTLIGGAGNDSFTVDDAGDVVVEFAGEGTDTVKSSISYVLGDNLENLTLTGVGALEGIGNASANTLTGTSGDDFLAGKAGKDKFLGRAGNDTYLLGRGDDSDTIQENDTTAGNIDALQFMAGINFDQLWFRKVSNNLEVSIIGTADKAVVKDWYLGNAYHVEQIKAGDGKLLLDTQVQSLVQAMAAFAPPPMGQTSLTAAQQTALAPVLAASWH